MVFLACLDILEDKESRGLLVSQDSLVPMARKEEGVLLESLVQEDREDQLVPGVREVLVVPLERSEPRVHQEVTALPVHWERGDCPDLKEQMDSLDQRGLLDHQGKMDCPDTLDREAKSDSKARLGPLVPQVLSDLRALQVRPANWVSVDIPALLDHQGSRAWLDPLERKEPRVTLVPLAALEKMDLLV